MKKRNIVQFVLVAAVVLSLGQSAASAADIPGITVLVSVASDGTLGNGPNFDPAISADGRFVAFRSEASNLVSGDTNDEDDIFVHDMRTGTTERVSISSDGTQANRSSYNASISGDGRFVAFSSSAKTLVPGDTQGEDVFVRDREAGITKIVSVASDGTFGGRRSYSPSISANGRFVVFISSDRYMVSNEWNGLDDIFIRDLQTDTTERVSIVGDPEPYPSPFGDVEFPVVATDGLFVAFSNNFPPPYVGLFVRDRSAGIVDQMQITCPPNLACAAAIPRSISDNGRYIVFYNLDYRNRGIFLHDRQTGITE